MAHAITMFLDGTARFSLSHETRGKFLFGLDDLDLAEPMLDGKARVFVYNSDGEARIDYGTHATRLNFNWPEGQAVLDNIDNVVDSLIELEANKAAEELTLAELAAEEAAEEVLRATKPSDDHYFVDGAWAVLPDLHYYDEDEEVFVEFSDAEAISYYEKGIAEFAEGLRFQIVGAASPIEISGWTINAQIVDLVESGVSVQNLPAKYLSKLNAEVQHDPRYDTPEELVAVWAEKSASYAMATALVQGIKSGAIHGMASVPVADLPAYIESVKANALAEFTAFMGG